MDNIFLDDKIVELCENILLVNVDDMKPFYKKICKMCDEFW